MSGEPTDITNVDLANPEMHYHEGKLHGPVPQWKYALIVDYGKRYGLKTFFETGTCYGWACEVARHHFEQVYSIELSPKYYSLAVERLHEYPNVHLFQGDSAKILGAILETTPNVPTLFWLDAHYSCGDTAKGEIDPPLEPELAAIYEHRPDAVILIDDQWDVAPEWLGSGRRVENEYGVTRITPRR